MLYHKTANQVRPWPPQAASWHRASVSVGRKKKTSQLANGAANLLKFGSKLNRRESRNNMAVASTDPCRYDTNTQYSPEEPRSRPRS